MLSRRAVLRLGGALFAAFELSCAAPPRSSAPRFHRVGALNVQEHLQGDVLGGLSEFGFEATEVSFDWRQSPGDREELLYPIAVEMATAPVDVIIANGTAAQRAAKRATSVVPIVIVTGIDPIAAGLAESLARPGGNLTGVGMGIEGDADGKRLEVLKEALPSISRVAIVSDDTPTRRVRRKATEDAARRLGVDVLTVEVHEAAELPQALERAVQEGADALLQIFVNGSCDGAGHSVRFAAARRIPAAYGSAICAEAGGLLVFGHNSAYQFRLVGNYVARILKGERPAEMPIAQPMTYELIVNLRTARELGLAIPQSILSRATRVIE